MRVGVLALQGAFNKHCLMLKSLGVDPVEVRHPEELTSCQGLILPGGESTTMLNLLERNDFFPELSLFAAKKPIFGTCAGLILMANCLKILDIEVERNGYGRQINSFSEEILIDLGKKRQIPFNALFIRAPRIVKISPDVKILASYRQEPVLVMQGIHLGATFHPELTTNSQVHRYYLELIDPIKAKGAGSPKSPHSLCK